MYAFFYSVSSLCFRVCVCVCLLFVCCWCWHVTREVEQAGLSDLEIISQPVEDENQCLAPPVQLVSFGYRDLPLAALDLSLAGSQLLSNADEDENREGWVKLVLNSVINKCLLFVLNICLCGKCEWQTCDYLSVSDLFSWWIQSEKRFASVNSLATGRCEWHTGGIFKN